MANKATTTTRRTSIQHERWAAATTGVERETEAMGAETTLTTARKD